VRVTPRGYGTTVQVLSIGSDADDDEPDSPDLELPLEEDEIPMVDVARPHATRSIETDAPHALVIAQLARLEQASVRELAKALGVSQSTALRALRELVVAKRVLRRGFARATRYSLPSDGDGRDP
jgi:DNA-binding transcriptional ArsR family regulator